MWHDIRFTSLQEADEAATPAVGFHLTTVFSMLNLVLPSNVALLQVVKLKLVCLNENMTFKREGEGKLQAAQLTLSNLSYSFLWLLTDFTLAECKKLQLCISF